MLIQQTILKEMAVDFLMQVEESGDLDMMEPGQIDSLLKKIKSDIARQLEEWKASDRRCDKAEELGCDRTKEQCLQIDCPFKVLAEQFFELFQKRYDRKVKSIRKRYLRGWEMDRQREEKKGADGKDWWTEFFEQRRKELMVEREKRIISDFLERQLFPITGRTERFWYVKARKRKDGKIIMNVTFRDEFIQQWPTFIQGALLELRSKMRTAERLVKLIRECRQTIEAKLVGDETAEKKKKRIKKKEIKKSTRKKRKKPNPKKASKKKKK